MNKGRLKRLVIFLIVVEITAVFLMYKSINNKEEVFSDDNIMAIHLEDMEVQVVRIIP